MGAGVGVGREGGSGREWERAGREQEGAAMEQEGVGGSGRSGRSRRVITM